MQSIAGACQFSAKKEGHRSAAEQYNNLIVKTKFEIEMPNEENFYVDNRPDSKNKRCFENCADPKAFEIVTTINGLTPTGHFKEDSGVAANHYDGNPSAASESGISKEKNDTKIFF